MRDFGLCGVCHVRMRISSSTLCVAALYLPTYIYIYIYIYINIRTHARARLAHAPNSRVQFIGTVFARPYLSYRNVTGVSAVYQSNPTASRC